MEPAVLILLNEMMKEIRGVKEKMDQLQLEPPQEKKDSNDEGAMTVEELKAYLGIGTTKAYELCNLKDFPCIKLGRRKVIPKRQLQEWLKKQSTEGKDYLRVIGR
ncbi:MAG: helix-turn-helix domain-containing protein [Clostridiaceae bacterium]|nr:helix-turn-helix domain-containing protein [Clostridiaceae bacterium]